MVFVGLNGFVKVFNNFGDFFLKVYVVSFINVLVFIGFGGWVYFFLDILLMIVFILVIFGVFILFLNLGVKSENKVIVYIVVLFIFVILFGFVMLLCGVIGWGDVVVIVCVVIMMVMIVWVMVVFVKSFIDVCKVCEVS